MLVTMTWQNGQGESSRDADGNTKADQKSRADVTIGLDLDGHG